MVHQHSELHYLRVCPPEESRKKLAFDIWSTSRMTPTYFEFVLMGCNEDVYQQIYKILKRCHISRNLVVHLEHMHAKVW